MPCLNQDNFFMFQNIQFCRKWWRRSIIPDFISRSVSCWMHGFWDWLILVLRSPNNIGSWSRKHVRASSKSGKCSQVENVVSMRR